MLVFVELGGSDPGVRVLEVVEKGATGVACKAERVII
jgi:hypothetical protein